MLQELTIDNLAIIDHLSLEFDDHMTVLTGETGAGKSIIIDAVSLLAGDGGPRSSSAREKRSSPCKGSLKFPNCRVTSPN